MLSQFSNRNIVKDRNLEEFTDCVGGCILPGPDNHGCHVGRIEKGKGHKLKKSAFHPSQMANSKILCCEIVVGIILDHL